jgi:CheY-like chemotaxis protein
VAENRNLDFEIRFDSRLPRSIYTDAKRLQQIIKNLLSNAFKFTHQGEVTLTVEPRSSGWSPECEELNHAAEVICFAVSDSGIGIPSDKQQIIFEAFQQADGSTNRKYGGTGLGLAISRELSRLLNGEIRLSSVPGRGSTFHLYLPTTYTPARPARKAHPTDSPASSRLLAATPAIEPGRNGHSANRIETLTSEPAMPLSNEYGDDRDNIRPGDRVLLIVENDAGFARFLLDAAREKGFKGLVTARGAAALTLAREYSPDAISLDIHLPDIDGWRVLERLKKDQNSRHIPVCVISTDDARDKALSSGCLAFLGKPIPSRDVLDGLLDYLDGYIGRPAPRLLLVEPDPVRREQIRRQLGDPAVLLTAVADSSTALREITEQGVDCVVLGPGADNMSEELLASVGPTAKFDGELSPISTRLPVIVYGEEQDDSAEIASWKRVSDVCTVRRVHSTNDLVDLTTYFLHRPIAKLPDPQRQRLNELYQTGDVLAGRKVLIVDDDMRNIFALTTILEESNMVVVYENNGRDAIRTLQTDEDIEIVLMDIMMPEMDGMETMREIRKIPQLKNLPIVAVTAKAMKGDREKCIEAGAWDYLSKPVDTELLLTVLRSWLRR